MPLNKVLKVNSDSELLSYIINVTPELQSEIDLPTQGESIAPIGKLIVNNERYKNAFINTINLIGLTIIDRNYWENPWKYFTDRGTLEFGQSVRELFVDIAKVYDYHTDRDNPTAFLNTVVPDVYNYIHDVNFQKYYKTSVNDAEIAMAFNTKGGLLSLAEKVAQSLNAGYEYDQYIVNKYMLCRRVLDGTVTSIEIDGYGSLDKRDRVAFIKNVSNLMTFKSPKYNPAGVRNQSAFEDQILIMNTDFEADYSTSVLATSYFLDQAQFKTNYALVDGFNNHDIARLSELLGSEFIPFTDDEITALGNIPCMIIDREFFQDYNYAFDTTPESVSDVKMTSFYNPQTLDNTMWLHAWKVISTSPFMQAVVFTKDVTPTVSAVDVTPSTATVSAGQKLQLSASVTTAGFANKAVSWSIDSDSESNPAKKATINQKGLLNIPAGHNHGNGTRGVYTLQITTALATTDTIVIEGVEYTPIATDDTAAEQVTALATALASLADFNVTGSSDTLTFQEKSGHYGAGKPVVNKSEVETGVVVEATTTEGVPAGKVVVKATSVYNTNVNDTATISVA
ncbi:MAG: Ig-like domain-containing protein [Turicibacter sp.]|nr:Ig-like domain-containing protein [Turicibacter sp.]